MDSKEHNKEFLLFQIKTIQVEFNQSSVDMTNENVMQWIINNAKKLRESYEQNR